MLSAFFDIQPAGAHDKSFKTPKRRAAAKKSGAAPKASEASTTSVHARFTPLPAETNIPKPAEVCTQQWQALSGSGVTRDDDIAEFKAGWDEDETCWDDEEAEDLDQLDDVSEPDFEPDSLDPLLEPSLSSSFEDDRGAASFFARRLKPAHHQAAAHQAVYSGPQLCCEDDDFD